MTVQTAIKIGDMLSKFNSTLNKETLHLDIWDIMFVVRPDDNDEVKKIMDDLSRALKRRR